MKMRKILLIIFIAFNLTSYSQMNEKLGKKEKLFASDSVIEKLQKLKDSALKARANLEKERINDSNNRNINNLLEVQKKRNATQKRNAIIRVAIGLGLLVILIIGWRRKAKK